jgi:hypothetical protein
MILEAALVAAGVRKGFETPEEREWIVSALL